MSFLTGIIAALAAPLVMSVGFIVWDNHWTGSPFSLNLFKCNLASIGFLILSIATRPDDPLSSAIFERQTVGFLMLSSVIGIVVGDLTWLEGLRLLGARRVIVMDSLKPFLAAVFGWALLGEELRLGALGGIVLTVVGILLVSLEADGGEIEAVVEEEQEEEEPMAIVHGASPATKITLQPDVEASARTECTAPAESSTLSLAKGSFSDPSMTVLPVTVDEPNAVIDIGIETETPAQHVANELPEENDKVPQQSSRPSLTNSSKRAQTQKQLQWGYTLSIINVVLDTYGSVLTKEYGTEFTTWEINLVRFGFAGLVMGAFSLILCLKDTLVPGKESQEFRNDEETNGSQSKWYQLPLQTMTKSSWAHVSLGVLLVTFFTPALSNYALFQIALALALTLGSVGPLYALPLTYLMQREEHTKRPSAKACLGALLAVSGIVVLAFWGTLE